MMFRNVCLMLVVLSAAAAFAQEKTREQKVREDKQRVEAEGFWIYNDIDKGFAEAARTGKPLLVVLRCLPCEECVKLDDELVDQDPVIRPLLQKFVCVRQVSTNGLDLSVFQFDTDQSFAVFMLNADKTIYGRFGTRSHRTEWIGDVSLEGLAKALQGALELHAGYPANKQQLAGKRGPTPEVTSPEKFPALREKYTDSLNYEGNVVQSCIHCHQIGDARRDTYRAAGEPIPESVLFPYPHPKAIGLTLDPREKAVVTEVAEESPAARAGFRAGDEIVSLAGQPPLSMADVQWVLQGISPEGGRVDVKVRRDGQTVPLELTLADGWRREGDISWRSSTWGLRRMSCGGMVLEELPDQERTELGLEPEAMALHVKRVGQYGPHATAKKAGIRAGDVLVSYDGRTDLHSETDVLVHGVTARKAGDRVAVELLRDGKRLTLQLPLQP